MWFSFPSLQEYSPKLIGFTGTEEEIRGVCKKFRVYFGKGERDENNDYIVSLSLLWRVIQKENISLSVKYAQMYNMNP